MGRAYGHPAQGSPDRSYEWKVRKVLYYDRCNGDLFAFEPRTGWIRLWIFDGLDQAHAAMARDGQVITVGSGRPGRR